MIAQLIADTLAEIHENPWGYSTAEMIGSFPLTPDDFDVPVIELDYDDIVIIDWL